jgi:hypothetical protein
MEEYGAAYMAEGIVTLAGSRMYTSAADTDEVIDDALGRFDRVFAAVDWPVGAEGRTDGRGGTAEEDAE